VLFRFLDSCNCRKAYFYLKGIQYQHAHFKLPLMVTRPYIDTQGPRRLVVMKVALQGQGQ
jgi:hypothetical protein